MAVELKFAGDSNDAVAAIARLERKYADLENKIKQTNTRKPKDDTDAWDRSLANVATRYASIGTAAGALGAIVRGVVNENIKLHDQIDKIAKKNAEGQVKLQIQGAMSAPEVQALIPGMEKSLKATPSTDMEGAFKLQTQLASSGFDAKDVKSGAALKTVLELKAATNQFGESIGDESEAVKSLSMLLKAGGSQNPNAADMRKLGGSIVSLFESSDVQFTDFKQLAPKITGLKQFGLSMEESVSAFSALTDVMGGNKADTGLAQFVSRTATAGAFKERSEVLKDVGLKPEDVAMAQGGKGFIETMDLMRERFSKMPQEKRNEAIAKLYGEEAGPAANFLFSESGAATVKDYLGKATNRAPFERNVQAFNESRYAAGARSSIEGEFSQLRLQGKVGGKTWSEYQQSTATAFSKELELSDGFMNRGLQTVGRVFQLAEEEKMKGLGLFPKEAFGKRGEFDSLTKALEENTEATRQATRNGGQRPVNRNGNVEE